MYSDKENINILTALFVEYGVLHVVVCPGSRNAAIVHNFNECPQIECHPVTDERSAAFVAMGISQQTKSLVGVCVTSGSALLNLFPGVAEATYQRCGIVAISADRPAEWIGQLDGQTMPQTAALGTFVSKNVSLPECNDDLGRWHCRRLVCEALNELINTGSSVHINVPISEPLFHFTNEQLPVVKAIRTIDWDCKENRDMILSKLNSALRPMIVFGQMDKKTVNENDFEELLSEKLVTLSEPISSNNPSPSLDVMFNNIGDDTEKYKPDLLLYFGGNTISKKLRLFLRTINDCIVVMVNEKAEIEDVTMHADYIVKGTNNDVLTTISSNYKENYATLPYRQLWADIKKKTSQQLSQPTDKIESEAVRTFESLMQKDSIVYYANSSAIRLAAKYANHYVNCNRGLNGIEGSLSVAVGASLATEEKVYCVIGDLSFFYDQNALWNQHISGNLRILLLNNGGGAIFRGLDGLNDSPASDELVVGSHKTTAVGACHQYGISRRMVSKFSELPDAIEWLINSESNSPLLLEVLTK